jgi:FkbM family methyltransferase
VSTDQESKWLFRLGRNSLLLPLGDPRLFYETWVMNVYSLMKMRPGDTVLDIGAACGDFTILASRAVGDSGRVIAVEPSTTSFALLQQNIALNDLKNVTIIRCAVTDSEGMYMLDSNGAVAPANCDSGGPSEMVPGTTLDRLVRNYGVRGSLLMKMDIEGGEVRATTGQNCLSSMRGIVMEVHGVWELETMRSRLRSLGFELSYFREADLVRNVVGAIAKYWPWLLLAEVKTRFFASRRTLIRILHAKRLVLTDEGPMRLRVLYAHRPSMPALAT